MDIQYDPPATAEELDGLIAKIERGEGAFASLSDEQRGQFLEDLGQTWVDQYLNQYPVPDDFDQAIAAYRDIEAARRYPHFPEHLRTDVLLRFEQRYGDGGPEHWGRIEE